jgi:hypothetical protein
MHYLSACLIFKDAASYLGEWLRFHLLVGVEHFYLYDNDSRDDFQSVIRPFLSDGRITLHRWPQRGEFVKAYQHCLDHHGETARWIAYIDDDEFLFPASDRSLSEALTAYEGYAGVAACWLLFGSNGHRKPPQGLVTRNYRRRGDWVDQHVKCIVNPAKVTAPAVAAHSFHCLSGEVIVDENHRPMSGPFAEQPSAEVFCLNHYVIKSHQEMVERRTRLQVDGASCVHSIAKWEWFDSFYNAVEDLRIQHFAVALEDDRDSPAHSARNTSSSDLSIRCSQLLAAVRRHFTL